MATGNYPRDGYAQLVYNMLAIERFTVTSEVKFSLGVVIDVCTHIGSAVDITCKMPFVFTGQSEELTIELN